MDKNQISMEKKIMDDITTGKVKLRSRSIFVVEKWGIGGAVFFCLLLAALFFHLFVFYLSSHDNLLYLQFGWTGFLAFLESFPYAIIAGLLVLLLVALLLIRKSDVAYKNPYIFSGVALIGAVIIGGVALAATDIAQRVEEEGYRAGIPSKMVKPLLHNCDFERKFSLPGRVVTTRETRLVLQTPGGIKQVVLATTTIETLNAGNFVVLVGRHTPHGFEPHGVRLVDERRVGMLGRCLHRRFPRGNTMPPSWLP